MSVDVNDVKYQVAVAHRILDESGLATAARAAAGHASMRIPSQPDQFVVKGRGYELDILARMRPEDMLVCDLNGYKVDGPPGTTQCGEVMMHACIYRMRPDVQAVVHVHPQFVLVMSLLGAPLRPLSQEGMRLGRKPPPVYPDARYIWSEEDGLAVATLMGDSRAIILAGHGATTAGRSLEDSVMTMVHLEDHAKMNWYAYCAAGPTYTGIPDQQLDEIANRTPRLGAMPHFRAHLAPDELPGGGSLWRYYVWKVSQDM